MAIQSGVRVLMKYSYLQSCSHFAKYSRSEFMFVQPQGQTREAWNVTGGSARVQRQRQLAHAASRLVRNACFACLSLEPYRHTLVVRDFCVVIPFCKQLYQNHHELSLSGRGRRLHCIQHTTSTQLASQSRASNRSGWSFISAS
jgi:hypothetical protein